MLSLVATIASAEKSLASSFSSDSFYNYIANPKELVGIRSANFIKKIKLNCEKKINSDSFPQNRSYQNIYNCQIENTNYLIGLNEYIKDKKTISDYFGLITDENKLFEITQKLKRACGKGFPLDDTKRLAHRTGWTEKANNNYDISMEIGTLKAENKTFLQLHLEENGAP